MFSLNERVVYPGHGVAQVSRIIEKKVAGKAAQFFELTFLQKQMTILVPVNNIVSVGIRRLSTRKNIDNIFKFLAEPFVADTHEVVTANWNKRNKEYLGKIRTGNLYEICEIYRDLKLVEVQKGLSFGEKNLLTQTENLLVEEIAIVSNLNKEEAINKLRTLISRVLHGFTGARRAAL